VEKDQNVEEVLKEGQEIEVKIIDIEPKTGKIKLSRKELLPRPPRRRMKKEILNKTRIIEQSPASAGFFIAIFVSSSKLICCN